MSKSKKRTISALLEGRQSGKFSSGGFDLLGEGDRIVAAIDDKAVQPKVAPPPPSLEELTALVDKLYKETDAKEIPAIDHNAIEDAAIAAIARRIYFENPIDPASDKAIAMEPIGIGAVARGATDKSISGFDVIDAALTGLGMGASAVAQESIAGSAIVMKAIECGSVVGCAIEGSAIVSEAMELNAVERGSIVSDVIAESAIEANPIVSSAIEDYAVAHESIVDYSIDGSAIENGSLVGDAIVGGAIISDAVANNAIESFAIVRNKETGVDPGRAQKEPIKKVDLKPSKLPSSKTLRGIGTRQAYQESHEEIERLKANSGTTTSIDNYVFDTLFKEINNASESMVYLYLWRRTYGSGKKNVELSYQVLADAIGVSKRGGQEVLKRLHEKKLIKIDLEGKTGIPSYEVLCPWQKK